MAERHRSEKMAIWRNFVNAALTMRRAIRAVSLSWALVQPFVTVIAALPHRFVLILVNAARSLGRQRSFIFMG
ncbi:hypothetical protein IB238_02310 [Rhizobium sp. ARZ01]|uniref:hypothetical protein n=1 Tax=Rhizobium sp. ARZ01 TaxID=2769313 RepID=UPI00177F2BBE|nr:hypothetical protein [Rhizobium sp. ARZ01]MBD9371473.1 hypothetical protein [Rhizobium sp. ARZ01]